MRPPATTCPEITPPALRLETARKLVSQVIRRIEYPKYGTPCRLTGCRRSRADAEATGLSVCAEFGFFEHGRTRLGESAHAKVLQKEIRNAIQGRTCLRLRCDWEICFSDAGEVLEENGYDAPDEEAARLAPALRDICREVMRTLRASLDYQLADNRRKARASFRSQRSFFLLVMGHLTGRGTRTMTAGTFDTRKSRFTAYLAIGFRAIEETGGTRPGLAAEITQALAQRVFQRSGGGESNP